MIRQHGMARETFYRTSYRWRRKYGGMHVSDTKRLRALEEENRQLERVVADQALSIQVLRDALGREWWRWSSVGPSLVRSCPTSGASVGRAGGLACTGAECGMFPIVGLTSRTVPDFANWPRRTHRTLSQVGELFMLVNDTTRLSAREPA